MKGEMAGAAVTIANPETSAARYHGRAAGTRCQSAVLRSPYSQEVERTFFKPKVCVRVVSAEDKAMCGGLSHLVDFDL